MKRLRYLWPGYRRAEEREMQEELAALEAIVGRRELGNLTLAAENARGVWGWEWLQSLVRDARYALRVLARQPSFAVVAVVSLGLGIGANAAIYSLMDALLWRQLPVTEPERLVRYPTDSYSYPVFREYAAKSQEYLDSVIATTGILSRDLDAGNGPERGRVEMVSGSYFPGLGVAPLIGRMLTPEDDSATGANAVVLSYRYWQRDLRRRAAAQSAGRCAWVMCRSPLSAWRGRNSSVWWWAKRQRRGRPCRRCPRCSRASPGWTATCTISTCWVRLRPGVNAVQASAALTPLAVATELASVRPNIPARFLKAIREQKLKLEPAANGISYLRARFSTPLRVLFTMVGIVLLLACVNVMSLGFARAEGRRHGTACAPRDWCGARKDRPATGDGGPGGGAGGRRAGPGDLPAGGQRAGVFALADDRTAAGREHAAVCVRDFAGGRADLRCGAGAGIDARAGVGRIAVRLARLHASSGPAGGGPRGGGGADGALCDLDCGGIFVRFQLAEADQLRYRTGSPAGWWWWMWTPRTSAYKGPQIAAMNRRVLERLGALPGVEAASFSGNGIYTGRNSNTAVVVDGFPPGDSDSDVNMTYLDHVGPHYFTTAGTRLVMGREFDERDNASGQGVAVVNQEFVNHFFNGQNPVGKGLYRRGEEQRYQIVGVVQDVRTDVRKEPKRMVFFSQLQTEGRLFTTRFLVRMRPDKKRGRPTCGPPCARRTPPFTWPPSIRRNSC